MMAPVTPKKLDLASILWVVLAGVIAIYLDSLGPQFATWLLPIEDSLQASVTENQVGSLKSWKIEIANTTENAFHVEVAPPPIKVVRASYEPTSTATAGWKGDLFRGRRLSILLIVDDPNVQL